MTEQGNESGLPVDEGGGSPSPSVPSIPAGDQLPSTPTGVTPDVAAKIEQLEATVKELKEKQIDIPDAIEQGIQGTKDRRFRVLREIDPDTLALFSQYLKQFDGNVALAQRELAVDLMLQDGASASPQPQGSGSGRATAATDAQMSAISVKVLTRAGIAFDDPRYDAYVTSKAGSEFTEKEWEDDLNDWTMGVVRGAPAGALISESGPPPAPTNLQQAYDKEFAALQGTRNVQGLMALKRKYRALGLDV